MKKILFFVALVLGMASCQNEPEGLDVMVGGEREVMLNVSLPESTRTSSNTGFDFTNFEDDSQYNLRYILEIAYGEHIYRDVKIAESTSVSFPVRLAPGRDYTFTVWADLVEENVTEETATADADLFYNTTEGLKKITFNEWTPNDEARDAYTQTLKMKYEAGMPVNLELTRPFAKMRVISTDIADIRKFGIEPTNASVKYLVPVYTAFNAVAGKVVTEETEENKVIVAEYPTAYADYETAEATLFADYIFVPAGGTIQFSMEVNAQDGLIKASSYTTPIPVVKNKLTTIRGAVLTEGGNVSIKVENELGEKETIKYVDTIATLQDAINAAEDGVETTIRLGGDVVIADVTTRAEAQYGLVIPATKVIVLDLNGKSISQTKECSASYSMIENYGTLTISDGSNNKTGKLSFKDTSAGDPTYGWGSYTISNRGGILVVNGGTIEHLGEQQAHMICAIWQYSGSSTINGGTISTPNYRSARLWSGDMTINGGNFEGQLWLQANDNSSNLTINGGTFAPRGGDYSSVFVTNIGKTVQFAVKGGHFTTKIGMSEPFGCITGGTFTTEAKEGTSEALLASGLAFKALENGNWTVESKGYYTDASGNYHITGAKGWLWMADQNDTFFRNKTIYLDNDIDFTGVDMRVTRMWTPEYSATFDGQNHTVSNIWMASDYDKNNQALFDGLMTVKNLKVDRASVFGMSQVGIIGANISGTIENCHVKDSRAYGYVWQVGGIVGLHSWGEIKNCSVEDTNIECYYYGAVGAIAGCMNEMSRNITNCSVKDCRLIKEGTAAEYASYDNLFGAFAGYLVASGTYTFSGSVENTTTKVNGVTTDAVVYGEAESSIVTFNGLQL